MKKISSVLLVAGWLAACNGDDKTTETNSAPVTPGIDNVNGNLPDTSETIRLNRPLPVDSTSADSLRDTTQIR